MAQKDFKILEQSINYTFTDKDLVKQAVVHRSYLNENPGFNLPHNERLEFLGDAVLELVVTEFLYKNYENPEGELTNWRASLVKGDMLAKVARKIGLERFLYLSKGEAKDTNPKARRYILANAVEALIGAMYLDGGYNECQEFIDTFILVELPEILEKKLYLDPKSRFQEAAQDRVGITPTYKVLEETGPDHNKYFKVGVYLENDLIADGDGTSKQEAQMAAAQQACEIKGW
jgi:ribonuclease-3